MPYQNCSGFHHSAFLLCLILTGSVCCSTLLITGIGTLVVLYSIFYLDKNREKLNNFYVYLLLFMTAMLGVVQSDNVISLYLFWELTSISSFLLIGYWYTRDRSRFGALKSMMITVFGGLMMLGGFVLLGIMGDTFSIRELIANSATFVGHEFFTLALDSHFTRCIYEVCPVSVLHLVAGCDGSAYTCQCVFTLRNDGESGTLSRRTIHTDLCRFRSMDLAGNRYRVADIVLGLILCSETD